jgi:Recombinase zinc beta ribbon domain
VRAGSALLSGLARCGRCGRRMTVRYHVRAQATACEYVCARQLTDYGAAGRCQALAGACVDALVTGQVLAALAPAAVEVSLRAAEQVTAERAELERLWRQRLERAQVAVDRARRCYRLAEPENRLVVRQLEADWEAALAAQQRLREDYDRFTRTRPRPLTAAQQRAIAALAADVEGLWAAPTTTDADRKQLIRALVDQVTITVLGASERVAVEVGWAGGHTTHAETVRPVARLDQLSCYPRLLERVRQLAEQGYRARAIANRLHAEGFRPAKGRQRIGVSAITQLLHQLGCPRAFTRERIVPPPGEEPGPGEWWLDDLAAELAMPPITLHSWIRRGWVQARQESRRPYRWIVHADGDQLAELRQRRSRPPGWYTRRRWAGSAPPAHTGSRDHAASPRI